MAQCQKLSLITMILAITMADLYCGATAQSSECTSVLIRLSPCIDYMTGNTSTPSSECCSRLSTVVKSQPECLCQVIDSGGSFMGISVNQTQALALPNACGVQTPPTSGCSAASPGNSPSGTTPSGNPKSVPSTDNGSSDASSTRYAVIPIVFWLLVATYAMVF